MTGPNLNDSEVRETGRLAKLAVQLSQPSWDFWVFHVDGDTGKRTLLGVSNDSDEMDALGSDPRGWEHYTDHLDRERGDWLELLNPGECFELIELYGPNSGYPPNSE